MPRRDYRAFVESQAPDGAAALRPGPIRGVDGRALGEHDGFAGYTVGQRKGLGGGAAEPRYVVAVEPESNTVVVGGADDVYSGALVAQGVTWAAEPPRDGRAEVRIRHRHAPAAARLTLEREGVVRVDFEAPQRAVTPGQAAVFYRGEEVLGGGVIARRRAS